MGARALPAGGVLTETSGETGVGPSPPRGHWAGSGEERRWPAQDLVSAARRRGGCAPPVTLQLPG